MRFFIARMKRDHLILGHLFFSVVNPEIDWKKKRVTGPAIDISTTGFSTAQGLLRKTQLQALRVCGRRPRSGETIYYRRVIATPKDLQENTGRSFIRRSNLGGEEGTGRSPHHATTPGKLTAEYIHYPKRKRATSGTSSEKNRREGTLAKGQHLLS
jgi:hypothetical protein